MKDKIIKFFTEPDSFRSVKEYFEKPEAVFINAVLLFVLLNVAASGLYFKIDMSRDQVNSLSESSEQVIESLDSPVLVEAYISRNIPGEILAMLQPVLSQLHSLERIAPAKMQVKIFNPDSEELMEQAERRGIQGLPIEQAKVDEASVRLGYFGLYIQYRDKSAVLNLVDNQSIVTDFEYRFLREVKSLTQERTRPVIGFLNSPGTLSARRWQNIQDQNKDNLYVFRSLAERELSAWQDLTLEEPVPENIQVIVIAGQPVLSKVQQFYFDQFLLRGGSALVMAAAFDFETGRADPRMAQLGLGGTSGGMARIAPSVEQTNSWLKQYGVEIRPEILFEPALSAPEMDIEGQYLVRLRNPAWAIYSKDTDNFASDSIAVASALQVVLPWFSGLRISSEAQKDVTYDTLVQTSSQAVVRESSSLNLKEMQSIGSDPAEYIEEIRPVIVYASGSFKSAFASEENLQELTGEDGPLNPERNPESSYLKSQAGATTGRLIVIGTPYMVSDVFWRNEANVQIFKVNYAFIMNLIETLRGDTDLVAARSRVQTIDYIEQPSGILQAVLPADWFSPGGVYETLFAWFHILTIPVILAVYGILRLKRRNRKQGVSL